MSLARSTRWWVLLSVIMAFLPIVLDMTILHVAIPSLTLALHASGTGVLWIIDIYPLVMASLLIPMGTLADRVGHRRLLISGLGIFALGSVLAAFSSSVGALIASRALMAVGAAMVMPCTLAIIRLAFENERERALALGVWGSVASLGAAVGPLVGGALLEHFWWGAVFLVNVPVMLVVMPLVIRYSPRTAVVGGAGWTLGQAIVLMVGIMATVYGLKSGFKADSSLWITGGTLVLGVGMLVGFGYKQLRSPHPMLDLSLFAIPAVRAGVTMALVVMGAFAGVELMLAQELQFVLGRTPLQAGLFLLPLMLASAAAGPLAGSIVRAFGLKAVASCALLVSALSLGVLAFTPLETGGLEVIFALATLGLALSIGMTASSVAIMGATPVDRAGAAGALEATSYDLGTGLGITVFGLVLGASYQRAFHIAGELPASIAHSASQSIGETMIAARALGGAQEKALMLAGQQAFGASHMVVLLSAAGLVAVASWVVWHMLKYGHQPGSTR